MLDLQTDDTTNPNGLTQIYSSARDEWRNGPPMPEPISFPGCVALNAHEGLIVGGRSGTTTLSKAYLFDRRTAKFTRIDDIYVAASVISCVKVQRENGAPFAVCAGGHYQGHAAMSPHVYEFDYALRQLVRRSVWEMPAGSSGRFTTAMGRIFWNDLEVGYEFFPEGKDGEHWEARPELIGTPNPIALQVDFYN